MKGKFHDISAGGARVYFPPAELARAPQAKPGLLAGAKLNAVIHSPTGKNIEIEGEIKHLLKGPDGQDHYGVEIKTDKVVVKNRLMSMVMDIQHKIVTGK